MSWPETWRGVCVCVSNSGSVLRKWGVAPGINATDGGHLKGAMDPQHKGLQGSKGAPSYPLASNKPLAY